MLEIFGRDRRRVAIAENAHSVKEEQKINSIWYLYFSLPCGDRKNRYCQPFCYVRWNGGELYRIMPAETAVTEYGSMEYQCEHVLATLIDNVLFGYHVVGNRGVYTRDCINYVLDRQKTKNWVLDRCDFNRQFEYGWEQETLLSALFSIAGPLSNYMWATDTSGYPWKLSLRALGTEAKPEMYVRYSHNMLSYGESKDPQQVCTRLYPLGYGEGVNQLDIAGVNGGVPYLQSPREYLDRYGVVERVWVDRRYEDPESLKAAARAMLDELQEPVKQYSIGFSQLDEGEYSKAAIGKKICILHPGLGTRVDTFITELKLDYGDIPGSTITVANRSTNIASRIADMADRQRIEQTYAQGATQLYAQTLQANCDSSNGAVMDFYIPEDMRIINKITAKVRMGSFRSYSKATQTASSQVVSSATSNTNTYSSSAGGGTSATTSDGGGITGTTSDGGETAVTSSAGGGTSTTTLDGGGITATTSDGGGSTVTSSAKTVANSNTEADRSDFGGPGAANHNHGFSPGMRVAYCDENGKVIGFRAFVPSGKHTHGAHSHSVEIKAHSHGVEVPDHSHQLDLQDHTHSVQLPAHSHTVTIPAHSHRLDLQNHSHSVKIPGHSHNVTIPSHSHEITPGIFFSGRPTSFSLYVNDTWKTTIYSTNAEIDLTQYLVDSSTKLIPRGSWLSIEIRPNDLAYVSIDMYVQGFVQSRGDATV